VDNLKKKRLASVNWSFIYATGSTGSHIGNWVRNYPGYCNYCGLNTGRTSEKENACFSGWNLKKKMTSNDNASLSSKFTINTPSVTGPIAKQCTVVSHDLAPSSPVPSPTSFVRKCPIKKLSGMSP
jgi:hypothetical protein